MPLESQGLGFDASARRRKEGLNNLETACLLRVLILTMSPTSGSNVPPRSHSVPEGQADA